MRRIAICVCTYNRPSGLQTLFTAIDAQRFLRMSDDEVHLVVVDNSSSASAVAVCETYAKHGRFKATFVHEPQKGLAIARNAAFAEAFKAGATHVASIDDDEVPDRVWLEALVDTLGSTGTAAVIGPVSPIFETKPSSWLPIGAYTDRRVPHAGIVDDGYTCNALLDSAAIIKSGLTFDMRFNETGGEDTYFFKELREKGFEIAWAEKAQVYSIVPRHRMSAAWILKRWYRTGMIEAHFGRHDPASAPGKIINLGRGVARVAGGAVRVAVAAVRPWRNPGAFVASFYTICRGAGLIANVFERDYKEYARVRYK